MIQHSNPSPRAGVSLVEVVLSVTILSGLFGWMAMVSRTSERAFEQRSASSDVELRSGIAMGNLVRELEIAIIDELVYDPATPGRLGYECLQDVIGTDLISSGERELRFEYDAGETNDGTDEDGDGVIDEGNVVLVTDVGTVNEARRVLARGIAEIAEGEAPNGVDDNGNGLVDEPGFYFELNGDVLGVSVTFLRDVPKSPEVVTRTVQTSIMLRN